MLWDEYEMYEARWRDEEEAEAVKARLAAQAVPVRLTRQEGFSPPPLLPTNLSVRTAR